MTKSKEDKPPWETWTYFDIQDLKKKCNECSRNGISPDNTVKIISRKLGIDANDVKEKMIERGLYKPEIKEKVIEIASYKKNPNELLVPKTIVHKYDIKPKLESFVDEERLKISEHNLRAEQVQLQKDLLNENRKRGNDIVRAINDNTVALVQMEVSLNKLIQYIEDATAGRLLKKKIEQETSPIQQTSES